MTGFIGELPEVVPTVQKTASNTQINELFKQNPTCTGIVITENEVPIGLITRTKFYQKLGTQYGYNLYINKSIELLMNRSILIVDYTMSIIDVSHAAMKRAEEDLYDYVIVTKYGLFMGVVSISTLLLKFAEIQAEFASYLNPLTGLPGNHLIEKKLSEVIQYEKFTVLYIDLDHFKTYNDLFGFSKGDQVLQETATLLKDVLEKDNGFLGHIGGDDFLAILNHHQYEWCCHQIIRRFDMLLSKFYPEKYRFQEFVFGEDRDGVKRKIPLLSISLAIVTNQKQTFLDTEQIVSYATEIKRICKQTLGSCYIDYLPAGV